MAPEVGLEPTTLRLTAECSAIELLRNALEHVEGTRCAVIIYNKSTLLGQSLSWNRPPLFPGTQGGPFSRATTSIHGASYT